MTFTPEQLQLLYRGRVALLLRVGMPVPYIADFPTLESLATDPDAVTRLKSAGLDQKKAEILARWAINAHDAERMGIPDLSPEAITALGVTSREVMVTIGTVFYNLYILAKSQPEDLLLAMDSGDNDLAETLIENGQLHLQYQTAPHLHHVRVFTVNADGIEQIAELPPYDPETATPEERADHLKGIVEFLKNEKIL